MTLRERILRNLAGALMATNDAIRSGTATPADFECKALLERRIATHLAASASEATR